MISRVVVQQLATPKIKSIGCRIGFIWLNATASHKQNKVRVGLRGVLFYHILGYPYRWGVDNFNEKFTWILLSDASLIQNAMLCYRQKNGCIFLLPRLLVRHTQASTSRTGYILLMHQRWFRTSWYQCELYNSSKHKYIGMWLINMYMQITNVLSLLICISLSLSLYLSLSIYILSRWNIPCYRYISEYYW